MTCMTDPYGTKRSVQKDALFLVGPGHSIQRRSDRACRERIVADGEAEISLDGEVYRLNQPLLRLHGRGGQIEGYVAAASGAATVTMVGTSITSMNGVTLMWWDEVAGSAIAACRHNAFSSAAYVSRSLPRSRSRLTSRITCAEASPISAR